jgi:hypothetical protein
VGHHGPINVEHGGCGGSIVASRHCGGSRVAGAVLPLHAAMVATKTPAATVMVGAQTTINIPLNAAEATVTETATTTAIKM